MRIIQACFLSLLLLLISTIATFACLPSWPDPWYQIDVDFEKGVLPPGVNIKTEYNQNTVHGFELLMLNESLEPIYLLDPKNEYQNSSGPPEVNSSNKVIYKFVSSEVYNWFTPTYGQVNNGWVKEEYRSGYNGYYIGKYRKLYPSEYIVDGAITQVFKNDRPFLVDIPKPQTIIIKTFYKGNLYPLKGELRYSLNKNYYSKAGSDPDACRNNNIYSTRPQTITEAIVLIGIPTILVGALLYLFIKHVRKAIKPVSSNPIVKNQESTPTSQEQIK